MASFEYEICTFIQLEVTGTYKEKIKNKFQQEAKNTHTSTGVLIDVSLANVNRICFDIIKNNYLKNLAKP